jgi:hypothetical protein
VGKDYDGNPFGCFNCKETGHIARNCPKKDTPTAVATPKPKGKIFVMSRADAEAHPDVITGTFHISDVPVLILFDTGASMSFISPPCALRTSLVAHTSESTPITMPSGEILSCSSVYSDVPISIAGSILPATLVQFPLAEFDVILGMDWLATYDARFLCRDQKIFLKGPLGNRITYRGVRTQPGVKFVSSLKLVSFQR